MSKDCKEAFYCWFRMVNGGIGHRCEGDEIISIDVISMEWGCQTDAGQCPGMGGFSLGCAGNTGNITYPDIPLECEWTVNPFGECHCNGQLTVSEDCTVREEIL